MISVQTTSFFKSVYKTALTMADGQTSSDLIHIHSYYLESGMGRKYCGAQVHLAGAIQSLTGTLELNRAIVGVISYTCAFQVKMCCEKDLFLEGLQCPCYVNQLPQHTWMKLTSLRTPSVSYSVREDFESSRRLNLDLFFVLISTVYYTLPGAKTAYWIKCTNFTAVPRYKMISCYWSII